MDEKAASIEIAASKARIEAVQAHADRQGESLGDFISRAINETMERDRENSRPLTGDEVDALNGLPLDD